MVSRRATLQGLIAFGVSRALRSGPLDPTFDLHEVAAGIHMRRGVDEDASAANEGAIANIGFIVGRKAVAVIDPGGSLQDGVRLRASLRKLTQLPIRYVLLTHVHPDHIFGAGAFVADEPQFVGHARLPAELAQRGAYYQQGLERILGSGRAGPLVAPSVLVSDHMRLDLGERPLHLTAHASAHTDCDLSVLDPLTGTLLLGDLLFLERVPSLDGSLRGWLGELDKLATIKAARAVPGHGPTSVNWPAGAADLRRYLETLRRETRAAIAQGIEIEKAVATVGRGERERWKLFDDYHGHNVIQAYKELEWE